MWSRWKRSASGDRGSVQPLLAIVVGGVALALALVVVSAVYRVRVARAQWAADAAARAAAAEVVAGAADGGPVARAAAERVAAANGGRLVSADVVGGAGSDYDLGPERRDLLPVSPVVVIEVERSGVRARAGAARFAVRPGD